MSAKTAVSAVSVSGLGRPGGSIVDNNSLGIVNIGTVGAQLDIQAKLIAELKVRLDTLAENLGPILCLPPVNKPSGPTQGEPRQELCALGNYVRNHNDEIGGLLATVNGLISALNL